MERGLLSEEVPSFPLCFCGNRTFSRHPVFISLINSLQATDLFPPPPSPQAMKKHYYPAIVRLFKLFEGEMKKESQEVDSFSQMNHHKVGMLIRPTVKYKEHS